MIQTSTLCYQDRGTTYFIAKIGMFDNSYFNNLLILFDNSRMGCFRYMFYDIKKSKLELIQHNQGPNYVGLILISTFEFLG